MKKYALRLNVLTYIEADSEDEAVAIFAAAPALTHYIDMGQKNDIVYDVEITGIEEVA